MSDCVFCNLLAEDPCSRTMVEFLDDKGRVEVVVFEPLNPVVPGHMLAVPVAHVAHAAVLPNLTGRTMRAAARFARDHYESFNIITSAGEGATQSVYHLHLHIVPRRVGDGLKLPWTDQLAEVQAPDELNAVGEDA